MVLVSLLGVREYFLDARHLRGFAGVSGHHFDRDHLIIPGAIVDTFKVDRGAIFKPIFDVLWNAGGFAGCRDYTASGDLNIDGSWFQDELIM
jgi:hypothetical protein